MGYTHKTPNFKRTKDSRETQSREKKMTYVNKIERLAVIEFVNVLRRFLDFSRLNTTQCNLLKSMCRIIEKTKYTLKAHYNYSRRYFIIPELCHLFYHTITQKITMNTLCVEINNLFATARLFTQDDFNLLISEFTPIPPFVYGQSSMINLRLLADVSALQLDYQENHY
jgi:hypothetical protein